MLSPNVSLAIRAKNMPTRFDHFVKDKLFCSVIDVEFKGKKYS